MAAARCPSAEISIHHTADDGLRTLREKPAELALAGLTFPDIDGFELLAVLRADRLVRRILVVSARRDERTLQLAREKRLDGYFDSWGENPEALSDAIDAILEGRRYFSPVLEENVQSQGTAQADGIGGSDGYPPLINLLTPSELQVCVLIACGCSDKQAAARFAVSPRTVQSHLQTAMAKLGLHSRWEVIRTLACRGYVRFESRGVMYPGIAIPGAEQGQVGAAKAPADRAVMVEKQALLSR
jgi:DNA-binding NarL/FixJ family response regulator